MARRSWRSRLRHTLRRFRRPSRLIPLLLGMAFVVAASALFIRSAVATKAELQSSIASATSLQSAIAVGDKAQAKASLSGLQASAAAAHQHSNGPLWAVLSKLPVVGDDINAVSVVSEVLDNIASRVMPPLVKISTQLDLSSFAPHDGKVDLKALAALNSPVANANSLLFVDNAKLRAIDVDRLNPIIKAPVAALAKRVDDAANATTITNDVLKLVPTMLGGKNRTYLLVFQNNAEARSSGGIAGAFLLAKVNNGRIKLGEQGSTARLNMAPPTSILTAEETDLYTDLMARFAQDANLTPEFPRTAHVLRNMVRANLGINVDGVIAVDPIAMSYVLNGTGPVNLPDGSRITAQNAVSELLNRVYFRYPNAIDSDNFFTDTAATLFTTVTDGIGDTGRTVRELVRASKERRILVWSAHQEEQDRLKSMLVSATLSRDSATQPTLGVYINDAVGAKLNYYLTYRTAVSTARCEGFGTQNLTANLAFRSTVPRDVNSLPPYILGASANNRPGRIKANVDIYLPSGGQLVSARLDGKDLASQVRRHKDHDVLTVPIALDPGTASNVKVRFNTAPGQSRTIQVLTTPGAQPGRNVSVQQSLCK